MLNSLSYFQRLHIIHITIRKPKQYRHGDKSLPHLLEISLLLYTAGTTVA